MQQNAKQRVRTAANIAAAAAMIALPVSASALAEVSVSAGAGQQGGGFERNGRGMQGQMQPGVMGTISAISGSTLTIAARTMPNAADTSSGTSYTVDASNATVFKDHATSTLSVLAVGDSVSVQGTVSGTSVTAKTIRDMVGQTGSREGGMNGASHAGAQISGNGQPVVGGTVSSISGGSITIVTTQGNVTYTIDGTNATVVKSNATSSLADIATGDRVIVQGTVSGTSVTATNIIDQGTTGSAGIETTGPTTTPPSQHRGILQMIGGFFTRIFGFF